MALLRAGVTLAARLATPRCVAPVCEAAKVGLVSFTGAVPSHASASPRCHASTISLPAALSPTKVGDVWHPAALSGRRAALLKKRATLALLAGAAPATPSTSDASGSVTALSKRAWNSEWDAPRISFVTRIPKGTRHDKRRAERVEKVTQGLASQEKRIADYKKTLPPKMMREGLMQYVKKSAWERD